MGIPPLPDPEWLQAGALAGALDSPGGGTLDFFDFFVFFSKRPKKRKKSKKIKKIRDPGSPPRGGFLAVGIPPLPDPEWLQAGALAGALDSPCGGTLDFLIFFSFFDFFNFFRKAKKIKKINIFFDFLDFFRKGKKTKKIKKIGTLGLPAWGVSGRGNPSSPGS